MAAMRFQFFLALFLLLNAFRASVGTVTSRSKGDDNGKAKVIELNGNSDVGPELSRVKRNAVKPGSGNVGNPSQADDLKRVFHDLKCERHNEAVVHWCGDKTQVIFLLTRRRLPDGSVEESTLYRSVDYGQTFNTVKLAQISKTPVVKNIYVSEADKKQLMFADVSNHVIYSTMDQGKSYNNVTVPFSPDRVLYHPVQSGWALGFSYSNHTLWYTKDGGTKWKFVQGNVQSRFYWGNPILDEATIVHMEVTDPYTGSHQYKRCSVTNCTDDPANILMADIDIYSLLVENDYVFVQKPEKTMRSLLHVSYKRGPFKQARFPHQLTPLDFKILDSVEGQVFIAVNYMEKVVHLYLSDQTGVYYTLTLDNVLHVPLVAGFNVDLYDVQSMSGVYIANQLSSDDHQPVTKMTFDKGGNWVSIPAPKKDSQGKDTKCEQPKCSLNLHLSYSTRAYNIPYILSESNAPGLIVAMGSIGKELRADEAHLFMSNDGGYSWREVFKGTYSVNILDQGGAMVAIKADFYTPTNIVSYSYDEGATWRNFTIHEQPIFVDGVLNEPGITTLQISVFGHWKRSVNSCWTIINLDFSSILKRKCNESDYLAWTPKDGSDQQPCILGRKLTYERRKADAECFVGANYTTYSMASPCECMSEDYECDFGYQKDGNDCKKFSWFNNTLPLEACPVGDKYRKSRGYRKIAADGCVGGKLEKKYQTVSTTCPVMEARGLTMTASQYPYAETHAQIEFVLTQEQGTKKGTTYQWDFDDGQKSKKTVGFDKMKKVGHVYTKSGMYRVTLTASNSAGESSVHLDLRVEDRLHAIHVTGPRIVQEGQPLRLNVSVSTRRHVGFTGVVHYVWTFKSQLGDSIVMTADENMTHTYRFPGKYVILVQALNGIGSAVRQLEIDVHVFVNVVRLYFSPNLEAIREESVVWRKEFEAVLLNKLLSALTVERNQVSVVVHSNTRRTIADVMIYGTSEVTKDKPGGQKLTNELLSAGNRRSPYQYSIQMILHDDVKIAVTSAVLLSGASPSVAPSSGVTINYTALFVALPFIVVVMILIPLLVRYYIRRSREFRHYRVLHNHTLEADTALDDDDEDDDPLIDAGIGGNQFMSVHGQFGDAGEPTLVMNYNHDTPRDPLVV